MKNQGVWPAYVAAVAGLVQSLLFVSAILALTVMQIGTLIGPKIDSSLATRLVKDKVPEGNNSVTTSPSSVKAKPRQLIFAEDALELSVETEHRLLELLKQDMKVGINHWELSIKTNIGDAQLLRAAYLRLMLIRTVMLKTGITPKQIDLRISPDLSANVEQVLQITPIINLQSKESP